MEQTSKRSEDLSDVLFGVVEHYGLRKAADDRAKRLQALEFLRRRVNERRMSADFVRYFTDEILRPGAISREGFHVVARPLIDEPERVRSTLLLALSRASAHAERG